MKRLLTLILSVLVLALSVMPCADGAISSEDKIVHVGSVPDQQDNPLQDDCSPFCQCSCCSGFSVQPTVILQSAHIFRIQARMHAHENDGLLQRSSAIWQPPQLV